MRIHYVSSTAMITVLLAGAVNADQLTDSGLYLSAGVGQNWIQSGIPEENTTVLEVAAGWELNPYFGLELNYSDLGKYPAPTSAFTDFDLTGVAVSVIGQYPVSERLAIYGKVGQLWWKADSTFFFFSRSTGQNQSGVLNFSESDPVLSLGASFELSQQIELDVEVSSYDFEFPSQSIFNNDSLALNLSLKFEL